MHFDVFLNSVLYMESHSEGQTLGPQPLEVFGSMLTVLRNGLRLGVHGQVTYPCLVSSIYHPVVFRVHVNLQEGKL